jgi:RNA polymerase sigma-70 factor (ECF subfamily)
MPLSSLQLSIEGDVNALEVSLDESAILEKRDLPLEEKVAQLFEAKSDAIFSFLVGVFGNADVAEIEDVTQETFLKCYRALQRGDQIKNVHAWLFRVAHNAAIDRLREQKFVSPVDDLKWDEIRDQLPDPALNPEQIAVKLEELAQLHGAVKRLSMQERQCLLLRVEGFRYREIGEMLGIAPTTVGEFLRRAMKKLMRERGGSKET